MLKWFDRVWFTTATTGTGTMTVGTAMSGYVTPAQASVPDGTQVTYVITNGADFEVGKGIYTSAGTTLSRDTVIFSLSGGTPGTSKINLGGSAQVYLTPASYDFNAAILDAPGTYALSGGM